MTRMRDSTRSPAAAGERRFFRKDAMTTPIGAGDGL
jgi:hypothetical protein